MSAKFERAKLTKLIAEWLIEWADDSKPGYSRYPVPSWADSERLADRITASLHASGCSTAGASPKTAQGHVAAEEAGE